MMPIYILILSAFGVILILAQLRRRGSLGGPSARTRTDAQTKEDRRAFRLLWLIVLVFAGSLVGSMQQCAKPN